jgi:hypothetical protein
VVLLPRIQQQRFGSSPRTDLVESCSNMMIPTTLVNIKDTQGEAYSSGMDGTICFGYFGWIVFNVRRYCEKEESLSSLDLRSYKTY